MQLDRNQVSVINANIAVLLAANTAQVELVSCPGCGTPCFADSAFGSFLCGYCGGGPFTAAEAEAVADIIDTTADLRGDQDGGPRAYVPPF